MKSLINSELLSVNNWLNANELILNALKSRASIIPIKTRQQAPNLKMTFDSCDNLVVDSVKYLCVYLNYKLPFAPHISHLQSKLYRSIGIISKIKYSTMFLTEYFSCYILQYLISIGHTV